MPSKATTKSKKEKPQQTQALISSSVNLGPPFAGTGAYPNGAWSKYPPNDGLIVPCPGFWGYAKRYPTVGGIVAQLGAEPATGAASCTFYSYYQYVFTPTVAGDHLIVLTMNLGPVTRRPRYGKVQIIGILQIMGPGGHWADLNEDLPSNTGITLAVTPRLQTTGAYTLRFGVAPVIQNVGYQSYGEAILNSAELKQYLPYGAQATPFARPKATQSDSLLTSVLNSGDAQEPGNISLHEAAAIGVGYSS